MKNEVDELLDVPFGQSADALLDLRANGRIRPLVIARPEALGLAGYMNGLSADRLDGEGFIAALDQAG